MITVKKLLTLKPRTLVRKCAAIFYEAARGEYEIDYINSIIEVLYSPKAKLVIDDNVYKKLDVLVSKLKNNEISYVLFEDFCQLLLTTLNAEPSDWDFKNEHGELDSTTRSVLSHSLVLDRIRSPFNVGATFRSADSFGIDHITLIEGTADPTHPRSIRTSRGTLDTVDYDIKSEKDLIKELEESGRKVFALELGGTSINEFDFPEDGICVIGSEEFGVSPELLEVCDKSLGRVSIPLAGSKGSINVSVATGIMLQAWFASED